MSRSCKECVHHNPDFIDKVCLHCSWPEFAGEPSNFKPKPITNYDLLIRKTPEELARWIWAVQSEIKHEDLFSTDGWYIWLMQEAEEGE